MEPADPRADQYTPAGPYRDGQGIDRSPCRATRHLTQTLHTHLQALQKANGVVTCHLDSEHLDVDCYPYPPPFLLLTPRKGEAATYTLTKTAGRRQHGEQHTQVGPAVPQHHTRQTQPHEGRPVQPPVDMCLVAHEEEEGGVVHKGPPRVATVDTNQLVQVDGWMDG